MSSKRRNGLESPYSRMQMSTWIALPLLVLQFGLFCTPILPLVPSIVCTVLFIGSCLAAGLFGYIATAVDPMDPRLSHDNNGDQPEKDGFLLQRIVKVPPRQPDFTPGVPVDENNNNNGNSHNHDDDDKVKYCWVCEHDVAEPSMHCRYCNKCVSNFDHHCQWLNTCIGERNYPYFYKTLWSIAALLVVHIGVLLGLVIDILAGGTSKDRANDWFSANLFQLVVAFNIFFLFFDLICIALILQLLSFHLKLRKQGLSTYQYILQDNTRKREQIKVTKARQSQRTVAIDQAKQDSKTVYRYRLIMGQYLARFHPCLDPLPTESVEQSTQQEATNGQQQQRAPVSEEVEEEHKENESADGETTSP
mmetsp:Transcript_5884/g.9778  ORF Transcript_5884/g.9778 Transcript_5884/m.9778 type:complete len:363 (-) Transcript_5884:108-1196(-)